MQILCHLSAIWEPGKSCLLFSLFFKVSWFSDATLSCVDLTILLVQNGRNNGVSGFIGKVNNKAFTTRWAWSTCFQILAEVRRGSVFAVTVRRMHGAVYGKCWHLTLIGSRHEPNYVLSEATRSRTKFKNKGHLGQKHAWILEIFPCSIRSQHILNVICCHDKEFLLEGSLIICTVKLGLTERTAWQDLLPRIIYALSILWRGNRVWLAGQFVLMCQKYLPEKRWNKQVQESISKEITRSGCIFTTLMQFIGLKPIKEV